MADLFHHDGEAHGVHLGVLAGGQRLYDDMLGAVDDDLCRLKLADALVVEDAALRPQDTKLSGAEGFAGVAELCQLCQNRFQPLFVAVPAVEAAVEGVAIALHPDLVAVVEAGDAGQSVDDGVSHPQLEHSFLVGVAGDTATALPLAAPAIGGLVGNDGQCALGVVGGEEVQRRIEGRGGVVLADGEDVGHGLTGVPSADEAQNGVLEGVVHHAVEALAQQIGAALVEAELGGGVLPHFAQKELIRADPLDGGAHFFNKFVGQLVGHVQTEACSAPAEPGVDDTALAGDKFDVGWRFFVDFGQGLEAPPAAVAALILGIEIVPAAVGGVGVTIGTALAVAALAVEIAAVGAGVAEHAVQHDADAVLPGLSAEGLEILVGTQQGVYVEVVGGVVAVVGVGLKDGVQVKVIHAHFAEVGQLHLDALEVAAEIVLVQVAAHLIGLPEGLGVLVGLIEPVREGHGLVLHALAEAVGEDLVEDLALDGGGRLKIGLIHGDLPALALLPAHDAAVVRPAHDAAEVGVEVEIVEVEAHVVEGDVHREVVLMGRLAVELHPVVDGDIVLALFLEDEVRVYIAQLLRDAEGQMHTLTGAHRSEGLLEVGVETIEQTRQKGSSFLKKSPGQRCHGALRYLGKIT